jgi:UDP-N-acetylglucosamine 1-carboxyvinyltransferase
MAAVAAQGTTVLRNAASEPHVQDLAHFLAALGATIEGVGTNTMTVHGGAALHGATHTVGPDHIEVGSFIGLAAVTRSGIRIERAGVEHLRSTLMGFERLGVRCEVDGADLVVPGNQSLRVQSDLGGHVPRSPTSRGPPSRPTPCRSRSSPRRSATAWCSCTRRCSSRACSSSTS